MRKSIRIDTLKCLAAGLLSEGDESPEYFWAVVDMVISAAGLNQDQFDEVAAELQSIQDNGLCRFQGGQSVPRWTRARRVRPAFSNLDAEIKSAAEDWGCSPRSRRLTHARSRARRGGLTIPDLNEQIKLAADDWKSWAKVAGR
jgi:hypothetical protein